MSSFTSSDLRWKKKPSKQGISVKNKGTESHSYTNLATCKTKLKAPGKYKFALKCDYGVGYRYIAIVTKRDYVIPGNEYKKKKLPFRSTIVKTQLKLPMQN